MSTKSILQWNCRGFHANREELDMLVHEYNSNIICLQETLVKGQPTYKGFTTYHKAGTIDAQGRAHGGVATFVKNNIPQSEVHLNTNLQAVATKVTINVTFTICSIYIPPPDLITITDLENLLQQLPHPAVLLGDFNAHNYLWYEEQNTDNKGRRMEDFMARNNLCLWNNGNPTYLHPATGALTAIDLSICSPQLFLNFQWDTDDDLHGSDHYPIIINSTTPQAEIKPPKWQFHKANWDTFKSHCEDKVKPGAFENSADQLEAFSNTIYAIAESCIPRSKTSTQRVEKPWVTPEIKTAIRERRKALKKYKRNMNQYNLQQFRLKRAIARQLIKASKRKSWRDYVSKLNSRSSAKKCWDMVRKISGRGTQMRMKHIKKKANSLHNLKILLTPWLKQYPKTLLPHTTLRNSKGIK